MIDRPDQVIHLALEPAHERRADPLGAGPHIDGIGQYPEAGWLRLAHPSINGHESNPRTIYGDLHLLGPDGLPEDLALRVCIRLDLEDVFAVGWEVVDHRNPTPGPERCPLDPILLRGRPRDPILG